MTNSNTEHSRKLRSKTATAAMTKKRADGKMAQMSIAGSPELIQSIRDGLALVDGKSAAEKIHNLLKSHNQQK